MALDIWKPPPPLCQSCFEAKEVGRVFFFFFFYPMLGRSGLFAAGWSPRGSGLSLGIDFSVHKDCPSAVSGELQ